MTTKSNSRVIYRGFWNTEYDNITTEVTENEFRVVYHDPFKPVTIEWLEKDAMGDDSWRQIRRSIDNGSVALCLISRVVK